MPKGMSHLGKNFIAGPKHRLARCAEALERSIAMDAVLALLGGCTRVLRRRPRSHILIAPPGRGNIGDFALCGAFLEHVSGPVTVVVRSVDDHPQLASLAQVTTVVDADLIYGNPIRRVRSLARLSRLLPHALSLSVVGADVMDGNYVLRASLARSQVARLAAASGARATILGFSWSPTPTDPAPREIMKAARTGVTLCARDPRSESRLRALGVEPRPVSDMVFAGDETDPATADRVLQAASLVGKPFAIVNASGFVGTDPAALRGYVGAIKALRARGYGILLLPHVYRHADGDLDAVEAVRAEAGEAPTSVVTELLSPSAVRSLTSRAGLVVTGRMHLAIMAIRMGVPAVPIATQGKVEGMLDFFGLANLAVAADATLAESLPGRVEEVAGALDEVRSQIAAAYPMVRRLALANFLDLSLDAKGEPRCSQTIG